MARRRARAAAVVLPLVIGLAACGGGDGGDGGDGGADDGDGGPLLVWTTEDLADRVTTQKAVLDAWAESAGTTVELTPIAEDQLSSVLAAAIAGNEQPDVIAALSLGGVQRLQTEGLLDTEAAAEVVSELGEDTFSESALELTRDEDTQLAVPSDAWPQMLFYRTDLFDAAGLEPPTSYDAITAAAQQLNTGGVAGIVAATAPADSFTHQTFEHIALANNCQLTDDGGEVALDSDECREAFQFYTSLIQNSSVQGNQDADTTRAAYFSGTAAMVIWSAFLLDELAGLRNDALPTCPECQADPTFLVKNTGTVTALEGPSAEEPAAYGEIVSWALLADANPDARDLVQYVLSEGYVDWLAVAPEGKVPVRKGTEDDPESYITAWGELEAGVDTKAPLSQFYDEQTLDAVVNSPDEISRWGFPQGQGAVAGAVAGQFVLPKALASAIGGASVDEALQQAADEAATIKDEVG